MTTRVNVSNQMLTWAVARAGFDLQAFIDNFPNLGSWLEGEKDPTVKQLEGFSKKVHIPFGYLFLPEPPAENLPIPYFRSGGDNDQKVSVNVYDTILIMQQRQEWLRDYLRDNQFEDLSFVGRFKNTWNIQDIVSDIRSVLDLPETWASSFKTWTDALNHLVEVVEDNGIITTFNGVVENNVYRKIPVDECRGFVLVDSIAPFLFINNSDFKSAQLFTIVHELAHIWTGHSAGFDFRRLQPADDPIEKLCDQVAAEFLVPEKAFNDIWEGVNQISKLAHHFKVSEIVIARRALDTGKWTKAEFFNFYEEYKNREFVKKSKQSSGGDFFATTRKRLSVTYASHINHAVKSGQLLYREAYQLTSLKGDTFANFFANHL
jgi:Zn-dependent peptidase ImmA (M78 family)